MVPGWFNSELSEVRCQEHPKVTHFIRILAPRQALPAVGRLWPSDNDDDDADDDDDQSQVNAAGKVKSVIQPCLPLLRPDFCIEQTLRVLQFEIESILVKTFYNYSFTI